MKHLITSIFLAGILAFPSCNTGYHVVSAEGERLAVTAVFDKEPDMTATEILKPYKEKVDSVMSPIIGYAANRLTSYRPESPLSNLIADILRQSAKQRLGFEPEIGIINMGGIRSILNEGEITIGDIYEISPFQNTLSVVDLKGDAVLELFSQIAAVHGEGISGAKLQISKDGKLLDATIGGKPVDPKKTYRIATIDYIAEGNDHMEAFKKASAKTQPSNAVLRDLFIEYVRANEHAGRFINAKTEGRIVEK